MYYYELATYLCIEGELINNSTIIHENTEFYLRHIENMISNEENEYYNKFTVYLLDYFSREFYRPNHRLSDQLDEDFKRFNKALDEYYEEETGYSQKYKKLVKLQAKSYIECYLDG